MPETSFVATLSSAQIAANFAEAQPPMAAPQALVEANRCYFCYDAPCVEACPTGIDVPGFIRGIATGNLAGAAEKVLSANIFGGSCARVCPTEILCERACVRTTETGEPIRIGALQRVATDWQMATGVQPFVRAPETGRRVAIVGAGPAGLSCAHALAVQGHKVTVFDAKAKAGGLNEYGIAAYKLTDDFAAREVAFITAIGGIKMEYCQALGETLQLDDLTEAFDAVFLGIGLRGANRLGIEGEDLPGVLDAVTFIASLRQTPDKAALQIGRRVLVIGGGNTAIDAATQAKFLGAEEVTMLYRRGPERMSATAAEQDWARKNGVNIRFWSTPLHIKSVPGALSIATERAIFVAEIVLKAVGQNFAGGGPEIENGRIRIDEAYQTSIAGVFAGGDCTAGIDLTVHAVQDGKLAARAIGKYLGRQHG
jgi:dihydropyrimidine dehydrogenase (NAD+) subunit PreT